MARLSASRYVPWNTASASGRHGADTIPPCALFGPRLRPYSALRCRHTCTVATTSLAVDMAIDSTLSAPAPSVHTSPSPHLTTSLESQPAARWQRVSPSPSIVAVAPSAPHGRRWASENILS
jgi:hypothetical protein